MLEWTGLVASGTSFTWFTLRSFLKQIVTINRKTPCRELIMSEIHSLGEDKYEVCELQVR